MERRGWVRAAPGQVYKNNLWRLRKITTRWRVPADMQVSPPNIVQRIESQEAEGRTLIGNSDESALERAFVETIRITAHSNDGCSVPTNLRGRKQRAGRRGHSLLVEWLQTDTRHPLNVKERSGWRPVDRSCIYGHLTLIEHLHKLGTPLHTADDALDTSLTLSRRNNHPAVAKWLEGQLTRRGASLESSRFLSSTAHSAPTDPEQDRAQLGARAAALARRNNRTRCPSGRS